MSPKEVAVKFSLVKGQRRIETKLSNIGYGSIQMGATRNGQLYAPKKPEGRDNHEFEEHDREDRKEHRKDYHNNRGCKPFELGQFDIDVADMKDHFLLV